MLKTGNLGIKAAIEELTNVNLSTRMRARHEAKLKQRRDQRAREQYVIEQGIEQGKMEAARNLIGVLPREVIAEKLGISLDIVLRLESGEK